MERVAERGDAMLFDFFGTLVDYEPNRRSQRYLDTYRQRALAWPVPIDPRARHRLPPAARLESVLDIEARLAS